MGWIILGQDGGRTCEPYELPGISWRAEELLSKRAILCPLLVKFDILCARYFEIRFCSFAQIVQSGIVRDSLYENCIVMYHTRILVVRTSAVCFYWKHYFEYTRVLISP